MVLFAVAGLIFLLTMYNAKLLYYMNWFKTSNELYDKIGILTAALSYSIGSISIMIWYNPEKRKVGAIVLKILFVLIDGIHVYVYNNTHIEDLATYLSPVYALQTSLIMFFLGMLIHRFLKENQDREIKKDEQTVFNKVIQLENEDLKSQIENLKANAAEYESDIDDKKSHIEALKSEIDEVKTMLIDKDSEIKLIQGKFQTYYEKYLRFEKSRILKKREDNRSEKEKELLAEAEFVNN
jgi:hypothetical protein